MWVGASYQSPGGSTFSSEKGDILIGRCEDYMLHRLRNAGQSLQSRKPSINPTNTSINHDNAASPVIRTENHILAVFSVGGSQGTRSYC